MDEVFALVDWPDHRESPLRPQIEHSSLWVGSVGYERHRDSAQFASALAGAGVRQLIDVRELPISRRRGYAKTALSGAMNTAGLKYVHVRALGNPKPIRELWKSGRLAEGRELYRQHLIDNGRGALAELVDLIQSAPSALMCVEHDAAVCHRSIILDALRVEHGIELCVVDVLRDG